MVVGACSEALAALPPYIRNPLTTNQITIGASMSIAGDVLEAVGGAGGPSTNTLPYTVPMVGTNFTISVRGLGPTNTCIITNFANAGLILTDVPPNKERLVLLIRNGSQGFCQIVTNGADNLRMTAVNTGITRSTNGGYTDTLVLVSDGNTNMILSGQNWGARP